MLGPVHKFSGTTKIDTFCAGHLLGYIRLSPQSFVVARMNIGMNRPTFQETIEQNRYPNAPQHAPACAWCIRSRTSISAWRCSRRRLNTIGILRNIGIPFSDPSFSKLVKVGLASEGVVLVARNRSNPGQLVDCGPQIDKIYTWAKFQSKRTGIISGQARPRFATS